MTDGLAFKDEAKGESKGFDGLCDLDCCDGLDGSDGLAGWDGLDCRDGLCRLDRFGDLDDSDGLDGLEVLKTFGGGCRTVGCCTENSNQQRTHDQHDQQRIQHQARIKRQHNYKFTSSWSKIVQAGTADTNSHRLIN